MKNKYKIQNLEEGARIILEKNTRTGQKNGRTYTFSVPSTTTYPFQWTGWDSQFHVIAWVRLGNIERAKQELESIFIWQNRDSNSSYYGFIPHMVFYDDKKVSRNPFHGHYLESRGRWTFLPFISKPKSSAFMQPPILAKSVEYVWKASRDKEFLMEAVSALGLYYKWLKNERDPDKDDLISVISQFETGVDYSPAHDLVNGYKVGQSSLRLKILTRIPSFFNKWVFNYNLRAIFRFTNFHFEDVLVNSIYAYGLYALSKLAKEAGNKDIELWSKNQADKTKNMLIEKCYDENAGLFWNLIGDKEEQSKTKTIISLMPLILPNLPKEIVENLVRHIIDKNEFYLPYPLSTVSKDENAFIANTTTSFFLWRGSTTMNINWLLVHGLRQYGYDDIADKIAEKSKKLVQEHGFNEFYNPITGEPAGAPDFGWATLVIDL